MYQFLLHTLKSIEQNREMHFNLSPHINLKMLEALGSQYHARKLNDQNEIEVIEAINVLSLDIRLANHIKYTHSKKNSRINLTKDHFFFFIGRISTLL